MNKKGVHVVPNGNSWSIRSAGGSRSTGTFANQKDAIEAARERARDRGTELYIHGRDGRIRERNSYAGGPFPPKD